MSTISLSAYLKNIEDLIKKQGFEQAINHCYYLLRQFPKMCEIYQLMGQAFFELDHFRGAYEVYSRLCTGTPDDFVVHMSMSLIFSEYNRYDLSEIHQETALSLQPGSKEIYDGLTQIRYHQRKDPETDIKQLSSFSAGMFLYNEKKFQKAKRCFEAAFEEKKSLLAMLYIGLSSFYSGEINESATIFAKVIEQSPFNYHALQAAAICAIDKNPVQFSQYIRRLSDMNPGFQFWEIRDNAIYPDTDKIPVIFHSWTGFPNTRIHIGGQKFAEKLVQNEFGKLPEWLSLLPSAPDLATVEPEKAKQYYILEGNPPSFLKKEKTSVSSEIALMEQMQRSAYKDQPEPQYEQETAPTGTEKEAELDKAFSFLEKVVTNGLPETLPVQAETAAIPAVPENDQEAIIKEDETDEEEQKKLLREAWNCFSRGEQDEGVARYKALLTSSVLRERIMQDIEKLAILFPENRELENIMNQKE